MISDTKELQAHLCGLFRMLRDRSKGFRTDKRTLSPMSAWAA